MTQGNTSIDDKVSSSAHMHLFECYDEDHAWASLDEYEGLTIDLGTEAKISEFHTERDMAGIVPNWLVARGKRAPLRDDQCDVDDGGLDEQPLGSELPRHQKMIQCEGDFFLRNSMPIPGTSHLIHGILSGAGESMKHYKTFFAQLKTIEKILHHSGRKERLQATCMMNTPFADMMPLIQAFSITLHEPRWHAVSVFCNMSVRPVSILRQCWSAQSYEANGTGTFLERTFEQQEDHRFRPAELTALLKSGLFRAYMQMIIKVHTIGSKLNKWFRGCPCHEGVLLEAGEDQWKRQRILKRDGLNKGRCPLASCRGWEIACGKLKQVLAEIRDATRQNLMDTLSMKNDGVTDALSDADLSLVLSDFEAGVSAIELGTSVKMAWMEQLPWQLCGLANPDHEEARAKAHHCIMLFNSAPAKMHHRKSKKFLEEGSELRTMIDEFVETGNLDAVLHFNILPFYFLPFDDAPIEREHIPLSRVARVKTRTARGSTFSTRRAEIIETRMGEDAVFKEKLIDHFCSIRHVKMAVRTFGLEKHPTFRDLMLRGPERDGPKQSTRFILKSLERLIYRQELSQKFEKHTFARKHHVKEDRKSAQESGRRKPKLPATPTTDSDLLVMNAHKHLQAVGREYLMFTVPLRPDGHLPFEGTSLEKSMDMVDDVLEEATQERQEARSAEVAIVVQKPAAQRVCFRVLHSAVGRIKTVSTFVHKTGPVLEHSDIAISIYDELPNSTHDSLAVKLEPRMFGNACSRVFIMNEFAPQCSLDKLLSDVKGVRRVDGHQPDVFYSLPVQAECTALHEALSTLLKLHAVPGSDAVVEDIDSTISPWLTLLDEGYVEIVTIEESRVEPGAEDMCGMRLTQAGVDSLIVGTQHREPQPCFTIRRDLALKDLSSFELCMLLKERGWEWRLLPTAVKDRKSLVHDASKEVGVWYTLGQTLLREYMICLLTCTFLHAKHGIEDVPHYRRKSTDYKKLMDGTVLEPDVDPPPRSKLKALGDDMGIDAMPAIEDLPIPESARKRPRHSEPAPESDADDLDENEDGFVDESLEADLAMLISEQLQLEEEVRQAEAANVDVPDVALNPVGGDVAVDAVEGVEGEDGDEDGDAAPDIRARRRLRIIPWGSCTVARKVLEGEEKAFEARCKYHRLSGSTQCKKTISYSGEEDETVALHACFWWLNQSAHHSRQSSHVKCLDSVLDLPFLPLAVLERDQPTVVPAKGTVKTDGQLDALEYKESRERGNHMAS